LPFVSGVGGSSGIFLSCRSNLTRVCYFCNFMYDSACSTSDVIFLEGTIHSIVTNFSTVETSNFFGKFFFFCWSKFYELGTRVGGPSKGLRFSPTRVGRGWVVASLRCVILLRHFLTIFGLMVYFDGGMLVND